MITAGRRTGGGPRVPSPSANTPPPMATASPPPATAGGLQACRRGRPASAQEQESARHRRGDHRQQEERGASEPSGPGDPEASRATSARRSSSRRGPALEAHTADARPRPAVRRRRGRRGRGRRRAGTSASGDGVDARGGLGFAVALATGSPWAGVALRLQARVSGVRFGCRLPVSVWVSARCGLGCRCRRDLRRLSGRVGVTRMWSQVCRRRVARKNTATIRRTLRDPL